MKKILILSVCIALISSSFKKSGVSSANHIFSADFKGQHNTFIGPYFTLFNEETLSTYVGALIDSNYVPEYSIELSFPGKNPGTYQIGLQNGATLILSHKFKVNNIDTLEIFYGMTGNISISDNDTINKSIQGGFNCILRNVLSLDTLSIKNGSFNITGN